MNDLGKYFELIYLIKKGNTQKVKDKINKFGLSFCPWLDEGYPLLTAAVEKDQVEMVACLLQNNAKVNSDHDVMSPLQIAAMNNNSIIFKMLLTRGATISNSNIHNNKSPIKLAVENNNMEIARLIIQHKNFGKKYDQSLLHTAVKNNNLEMVSLLLEAGADVNEYDDEGSAPIHHAVMVHNNDILQLLIDYGADINAKDKYGNTSVFLFIENGRIISDSLIHYLPRSYLADRRSYNILSILLDNDADINVPNIKKYLPFYVAVRGYRRNYGSHNKDPEKIKCLIKQIVKLKSLNAPLSRDNDELLSSIAQFQPFHNYKKKCELEIKKIIAEKLPNSGISLHNILSKNIHVLTSYAKNKNHETFIFSDELSRRFPIYGLTIDVRFSKGLARRNLLEKSAQVFQNVFPVASKLLSHGVANVFECLDNNDLRIFLRMFQQDN